MIASSIALACPAGVRVHLPPNLYISLAFTLLAGLAAGLAAVWQVGRQVRCLCASAAQQLVIEGCGTVGMILFAAQPELTRPSPLHGHRLPRTQCTVAHSHCVEQSGPAGPISCHHRNNLTGRPLTALQPMQGAWGAGLLRTLAAILATRAYQICEP